MNLRQAEVLDQPLFRHLGILGAADQSDHCVEVIEGDLQSLEDVESLLGLAQIVGGAPRDHLFAVVEEGF